MKFHLVYRNGRFESAIDEVEPGIESIDQGVLGPTSHPSEVYLEVPGSQNASSFAEQNPANPNPYAFPAKEFYPDSQELYDERLRASYSATPNPYNGQFQEPAGNKFRLPISDEYDPEGNKIDWRTVDERIITKILEQRNKSKIIQDFYNAQKETWDQSKSAEEDKEEIIKVNDVTERNSTETVKTIAHGVVSANIERAVTVAKQIMKEIDLELRQETNEQQTKENIINDIVHTHENYSKKDTISDEVLHDESSDIPKSVKESVDFFETIDLRTDLTTNQEEVMREKKLSLIQEMEESLTLRKLSGLEMAQRSAKKPKELTHKMNTVISEIHSKFNIKIPQRTLTQSERSSEVYSEQDQVTNTRQTLEWLANMGKQEREQLKKDIMEHSEESSIFYNEKDQVTSILNIIEWLSKMDKEEREQIKCDIKLAILTAARKLAESQKASVHTFNHSQETATELIGPNTYVPTIESIVYNNKNAINDYTTKSKTESSTVNKEYSKTETEYIKTESYKKVFESKEVFDERKILSNSSDNQDIEMRTEYVATVTVEHKQLPIISTVSKEEIHSEIHKDLLEQKQLNKNTAESSAVDEVKNKKVIVEFKDEAAEKITLEKIVSIEAGEVARDIGELKVGKICDIDMQQAEALAVTDTKGSSKEDKLIVAFIINKAVIEEIGMVFDETILEPFIVTEPDENLALTKEERHEFTKTQSVVNATVANLNVNNTGSESISKIITYSSGQIKANISEELNQFVKALSTYTASGQHLETKTIESNKFEVTPVKVESAVSSEEVRDFVRIQAVCQATAQEINEIFAEPEIVSISYDAKEETVNVLIEPDILCTATSTTPCLLQLQTENVQEISEKLEDAETVEYHIKKERAKAAVDESASLTIVKEVEIEIIYPVLAIYEEDEAITSHSETESVTAQLSAINLSSETAQQTIKTEKINQESSMSNTPRSYAKTSYSSEQMSAVKKEMNVERLKQTSTKTQSSVSVEESMISIEEASKASREMKSEKLLENKVSGKSAMKTNLRQDQAEENAVVSTKNNGVIIPPEQENDLPLPPTPLTDEYMFKLVTSLPKSRATTPVPEPPPEVSLDYKIAAKKKLRPDPKLGERSSPVPPTPPSSPVHAPVYTKPGLNGGMRLPRYIKPGLRGGCNSPTMSTEEILDVQRKSSLLTSAITETLKSIERYKKDVGILKLAGVSDTEFAMEIDETIGSRDDADRPVRGKVVDIPIHLSADEECERKPKKVEQHDLENTLEEVTLADDADTAAKREHSETIEECFDEVANEAKITEGVVEFPNDTDDQQTKDRSDEELIPSNQIKIEPEDKGRAVDKDLPRIEEEIFGTPDEQPNNQNTDIPIDANDQEVARVVALEVNAGADEHRSRSPALSPRETEILKEASVKSLTRVLSSHMIREGVSPEPASIESILGDEKKVREEAPKETSWTVFLQKQAHPAPGNTLKHISDLQKLFESKAEFLVKPEGRKFTKVHNKSPAPWQERALADTLGAPSPCRSEESLEPGTPPEFLVAVPPEPVPGEDGEAAAQQDGEESAPKAEGEQTTEQENKNDEKEDTGDYKEKVDSTEGEEVKTDDSLALEEERERLAKLLTKSITPVADPNNPIEDKLNKLKEQLEALAQVPEIIRMALGNLTEQLSVIINQKKEESTAQTEEVKDAEAEKTTDEEEKPEEEEKTEGEEKTEEEKETEEGVQETEEPTEAEKTDGEKKEDSTQAKSEEEGEQKSESVADGTPTETEGGVTDTESTDNVQKRPRSSRRKPRPKPEPAFGRITPDPVEFIIPYERRQHYRTDLDEQTIAETILAQSEVIKGKALGINFKKFGKPPVILDHLQRSEVFKVIHNQVPRPPNRVAMRPSAIAETDYREKCRSVSPCPPGYGRDHHSSSDQFQP